MAGLSQIGELELAFWRQELESADLLEIPTDRPRPASQTARNVRSVATAMDQRLLESLERWELPRVFLAVAQTLLLRLGGQADFVVGLPRDTPEFNLLPCRGDLGGDPTFLDLLNRTEAQAERLGPHGDLPLESLIRGLWPDIEPGLNPLFRWTVATADLEEGAGKAVALAWADVEVSFQVRDGARVEIFYDADLFDQTTVLRWAQYLVRMLEGVAANPESRLSELPFLAAAERHHVRIEVNDTDSSYPRDQSLGEIFTAEANEHGDAVAMVYGERAWSYRELEERSNRMAHRLRALGLQRESLVALYMERGGDLITAMLAVLKAGGAYLPLDVSYPERRLGDMLKDATPRILLADKPTPEALRGDWREWIFAGDEELVEEPTSAPVNWNEATDLAYVIYTSGSTGRPKGAAVVHRAISRLVIDTNYVTFGPGDHVAQASNSSFDAATFEIWGALLTGATLVGVVKETLLSSVALAPVLAEQKISTLFLTPALYNQLVAESPALFASVRQLVLGGEALDPRAVGLALRHGAPDRLINGYGPTENTTFSVTHRIPSVEEGAASVPIGWPIAASTAYVVDRDGGLASLGGVGELLLGGDGLARGYLKRPSLTAERFVPNPWSAEPGGRLYRSGDLARRLAGGEIDFLGRLDDQIKLNGFRIELGEIEAVLESYGAVQQSVVMVRALADEEDRQLVAYVVPDTEKLSEATTQDEEDWGQDQVDQWEMVFDDLYVQDAATDDFRFNIVGWEDTASGQPIPADQMREWLDDTVEQIMAQKPRRVLELGCGTGMLAFAVAPHCELYHATDLSQQALEYIDSQRKHFDDGLPQLVLEHRSAEDLGAFEAGSFDTIIVNSVAQYFPGAEYLAEVVEGALRLLAPGGQFLLGDLRSLPLVEPFHVLVSLGQAAEDSWSLATLLQHVRAGVLAEEELLIAPAFFRLLQERLPNLETVEILTKKGWAHNELTRCRFLAILRVAGETREAPAEVAWEDWDAAALTLESLAARLDGEQCLGFASIPNARLAEPLAWRELADVEPALTVGEARQRVAAAIPAGVEPQALWDLAESAGYELELSWTRHDVEGRVDAFFRPQGQARRPIAWPAAPPVRPPLSTWTSTPLQGRWSAKLTPELRSYLGDRLPEYMVPARYMLLESLPINPNGKVDRKRLPAPERVRLDLTASYVAPRNPVEERLAGIWAEVLGLAQVGIEDDFFDLGGHSLLATQVVSRVRKLFGAELSLRAMFEAPTVALMAPMVSSDSADGESERSLPPIEPLPRPDGIPSGDVPLSFAQQRLWFLDQLNPGNPFYVMPMAWSLSGRLDVGVLAASLNEIVRRHETLRTRYVTEGGLGRQIFSRHEVLSLTVADLRDLPPAAAQKQAERMAFREATQPFDLERELPLRAAVLLTAEDEAVLLLSLHHIVGDGWSLGVLEEEIRDLYPGIAAGRPPAEILGDLQVQYADFAVWQRDWLQGERLEEQLAYWRQELDGLSMLELPIDRPRSAVKGFRGRHQVVRFGPELSDALQELSQAHGATLYMTMLAAFQALLHRLSGANDIVVGSPIANRHYAALEELIGFFVNALTMRAVFEGDPLYTDLLEKTREKALGAYAHQDLPFDRLVEELSPDRDPGLNPLFQVVFAVQNAPRTVLELGDVSFRFLELDLKTVRFDLELHVFESPQGFDLSVFYDLELFDDTTIQRLGERFVRILRTLTSNAGQRVSALPLLSSAERQQALVEWNDIASAVDSQGEMVHLLFAALAEAQPERTAVVGQGASGRKELSYGELDEWSNRLAQVLRQRGVGPESILAVFLERSPEMVVAILAVLKAGGAYLPIDPALPDARIVYQVNDSGAAHVLTVQALSGRLDGVGDVVLNLDSPELVAEIESASAEAPVVSLDPANLAYVIYTSGSTGRPKGTQLVHRGLANLASWHREAYEVGPEARATMVAGLGFDASVWELWPYLTAGASLHLGVSEDLAETSRLIEWWRREGITLSFLPTPMAEAVLGEELPADLQLSSLLTGGDRLHRYPEKDLPLTLVNHYGPTECTVVSTWTPLSQGDLSQGDLVQGGSQAPPIGRPLPGTRSLILDRQLAPVPIGVAGELMIGGVQLARGYLGRPALTAQAFVPDPTAATPGERLYRSGDLVRFLADGNVDFIGRIDHQVKLRGFRIELGEIEVALEAHSWVRQGVVMAFGATDEDRQLVAYVVVSEDAAEEESVLVSQLRAHLSERLPSYMVPARYRTLESMPLNASGKVDRKRLPSPESAHLALGSSYVAPRNATEEKLAGLWAEVLGVERVGVNDDFFELGGHSLLATQLISRMETAFDVELPMRTVFEAKTVAQMRDVLANAQGASRSLVPITPLARRNGVPVEEVPLSLAQQRLWFLDRMHPGNPFYIIAMALMLEGPLQPGLLRMALSEIVRRHEVLRTRFREEGGQPQQVISAEMDVPLPWVDLSGLPAPTMDAEVRKLAIRESLLPFNLERDLLLRHTLLSCGPDKAALLFTLHHIIGDGWSIGVLEEEIGRLYAGLSEGRPAAEILEEPSIQYADFAVWHWGQVETLERDLDYWRSELSEAPQLELPVDRPRPAVKSFRGLSRSVLLDQKSSGALKALAQDNDATLYMTMLAALQVTLHRWTGENDIVIGSVIANRRHPAIEGLIGFFVNALALRGHVIGDPTFAALLGDAKETALGAYAHQDLPFDRIVEELSPARDAGKHPFFEVVLAVQEAPRVLEAADLSFRFMEFEVKTARCDVEFHVFDSADGLEIDLVYAPELFDPTTVQRLLRRFVGVLEAVNSGQRISDIPFGDAAERHQLLVEWNHHYRWSAAASALDPAATLLKAIEEQVARTPDAVAIETRDRDVTYRRLNARANHLANELVARGVGNNDVVAVAVDWMPDAVEGFLGAWKAGAAFLPLDLAQPPEKRAFMLKDANARAVVARPDVIDRLVGELADAEVAVELVGLTGEEAEVGPGVDPWPESMAYVIYTSGSTGQPKGVMISHQQVLPVVAWFVDRFQIDEGARFLQTLSHVFDFAFMDWTMAFVRGGSVYCPEVEERADVARLVEIVDEYRPNVVNAIPSLFQEMVALGQPMPSLRNVHLGGEAFPAAILRQIGPLTSDDCYIWNGCGPTETSVNAVIERMSCAAPERGLRGATVPIGRSIGPTTAYILDRRGRPLGIGSPGELVIGSGRVGMGYLRRPALTAEKFFPDALSGNKGARLYHCGDLARFLGDGRIEFLGRIDHQVKIRGFRMELGEIEAAIGRAPEVREVVVLAREDAPGEPRLVAYVVPGEERGQVDTKRIDTTVLQKDLGQLLPGYMVPRDWVVLETFPRTMSGKVDRKVLPAPDYSRREATAMSDPVEEILAAIWSRFLGVDGVERDDDFFHLGGHSLLLTRVQSHIRQVLGVSLPLPFLFEHSVLADLASEVERLRTSTSYTLSSISRRPAQGQAPLSFSQQRMWFLERLMPGNPFYISQAPMHLTGALDVGRLGKALAEIVDRHEALRTVFPAAEGQPVQDVLAAIPCLAVVDLEGLPPEVLEPERQRLMDADALRSFDLASDLPCRWTLLREGPDAHDLLATFHHIAADGWSFYVFFEELRALYGDGDPLAALPIQYADFAAWQQEEMRHGPRFAEQLDYWRSELADLEGAPLPFDRPRPAVSRFRGREIHHTLDAQTLVALKELSQANQVTLFMTLLSAFNVLFHRLSGSEQVVVGTPIANRNHAEIESLIGFFVNNLVLRSDLAGDPEGVDFLHRTRGRALAAYTHQDVPFEKLVEELHPERSLNQNPLFQVMFSLQNAPQMAKDLGNVGMELVEQEIQTARFDLELQAVEAEAGLDLLMAFDVDLIDASTALRWVGYYENLLKDLVAHPSRRVSDLVMLSAAEQHQVQREWSHTGMILPPPSTVHGLFEEQVGRTPRAIALVSGDDETTYAELDRRANGLARALARRGVGAGDIVGVAVESVPAAVEALLGIMKVGATYLPLDLNQPRPKLFFMVEDASAKALVSDSRHLEELAADPAAPAHVLALGSDEDGTEALPRVAPELPAYVIYTSGTTGKPKGVVISHQQVVPILSWYIDVFRIDGNTRVLQTLAHVFDFGFLEMMMTLAGGGRLYCTDVKERANVKHLAEMIDEHRLNLVNGTPSLFREVLALGRPLPTLTDVCLGGEAFPSALVERLAELTGDHCRIYNGYGPTETAVSAALQRMSGRPLAPEFAGPTMPIGRATGPTQLFVVDRRARPVGIGVAGELVIGGHGVGTGYLRRAALTAEKFFPNDLSEVAGGRLYHSGDLVRSLADGRMEFLGRIDHQVKIRGFRMELGEIEAALDRLPELSEAVVLARGEDDPRLVAFVVLDEAGQDLDTADLQATLREALPAYMVPRDFVVLESMPRTPNGKVDLKALPLSTEGGAREAFVEPSTPLAGVVAEVWGEVLGREGIGMNDNFFSLGGHSLLAAQLITRLDEALGLDLGLALIFETESLGELVNAVEKILRSSDGGEEILEYLDSLDNLSQSEEKILSKDPVSLAGGKEE